MLRGAKRGFNAAPPPQADTAMRSIASGARRALGFSKSPEASLFCRLRGNTCVCFLAVQREYNNKASGAPGLSLWARNGELPLLPENCSCCEPRVGGFCASPTKKKTRLGPSPFSNICGIPSAAFSRLRFALPAFFVRCVIPEASSCACFGEAVYRLRGQLGSGRGLPAALSSVSCSPSCIWAWGSPA